MVDHFFREAETHLNNAAAKKPSDATAEALTGIGFALLAIASRLDNLQGRLSRELDLTSGSVGSEFTSRVPPTPESIRPAQGPGKVTLQPPIKRTP